MNKIEAHDLFWGHPLGVEEVSRVYTYDSDGSDEATVEIRDTSFGRFEKL